MGGGLFDPREGEPYPVAPQILQHIRAGQPAQRRPRRGRQPCSRRERDKHPALQANIQSLDTEIGRLLKEVDLKKTVVIFVGDNGVPPPVTDVGQKIRGSKGSVYEGGVRVPLVIAGAGVTRRGREDDLFVASDLYATVLNLTGAAVSQVGDSYSVKPLLGDEAGTSGRTHSYSESGRDQNHQYALRDARFKLVKNSSGRALYDLATDPEETQNLYTSAAHAAVRANLEAEVAKLKVGASPSLRHAQDGRHGSSRADKLRAAGCVRRRAGRGAAPGRAARSGTVACALALPTCDRGRPPIGPLSSTLSFDSPAAAGKICIAGPHVVS